MSRNELQNSAIELLMKLISTKSFSTEEEQTADLLASHFDDLSIPFQRSGNNLWVVNKEYDPKKPNILLNSHHDTVKPNTAYTRDPFDPIVENGKLYGLGSNDAGASLVSLISVFNYFYATADLPYNLILAATAEEENSGDGGIRKILPQLPDINFALVGEPTEMQMAISEKGLLVIDAYASGVAGHAAHLVGENAIYKAVEDIRVLSQYSFAKVSSTLGAVKMTVTQVDAGTQHNVVPASCHFVIDVRTNDEYTNQEIFETLNQLTKSQLVPRSFKHNSSSIAKDHPVVVSGLSVGLNTYGSPTLSDQSALSCPSLKMGPGKSSRSHSADEYIELSEIEDAIILYIEIFDNLFKQQ